MNADVTSKRVKVKSSSVFLLLAVCDLNTLLDEESSPDTGDLSHDITCIM